MLNIISHSIVSKHNRGPRKVVLNTIKGLDLLGYPYVVNAALEATKTLWIHDDPESLIEAMKLPVDVAILAGPNIYTLPSEIPESVDLSRVIWIHPAPWVRKLWQTCSTREIPSVVWPTGIDTKLFAPTSVTKKDLVLVYIKQRSKSEVEAVCQALKSRQESYKIITYGKYLESDYLALLARSKAIIWVGRSESQGVGLLEAMAMNVPVLVYEIKKFGQWTGDGHELFSKEQLAFTSALTAPYFDDNCGIKFTDASEIEEKLSNFLFRLTEFKPRAYIETNLSLKKQAEEFVNIYQKHFGQSKSELMDTILASNKKWRNATMYFKIKTSLKDAIRGIIR